MHRADCGFCGARDVPCDITTARVNLTITGRPVPDAARDENGRLVGGIVVLALCAACWRGMGTSATDAIASALAAK